MFIHVSMSFHMVSLLPRIFFPRFLHKVNSYSSFRMQSTCPNLQQLAEFRRLRMDVTSFAHSWRYFVPPNTFASLPCTLYSIFPYLLKNLLATVFPSLFTPMFLLHWSIPISMGKFNYFSYNNLKTLLT